MTLYSYLDLFMTHIIKNISVDLVDGNSHIVNKVMIAKKPTHDGHSIRKYIALLLASPTREDSITLHYADKEINYSEYIHNHSK